MWRGGRCWIDNGDRADAGCEIRAYVDKVWPSFLDDLEALVVVPSVVDESRAVAGAPWGLECHRALCVAMDVARRQGLSDR